MSETYTDIGLDTAMTYARKSGALLADLKSAAASLELAAQFLRRGHPPAEIADWLDQKAEVARVAIADAQAMPPEAPRPNHNQDKGCSLDTGLACVVCGVDHSAECLTCSGRGFHREGCAEIQGAAA